MNVADRGSDFIDGGDAECEHINWLNELSGDVEDSLSEVLVSLFALVVGLAFFESHLCRLAMVEIILGHEGVEANELRNGLGAHRELMLETAEFRVVLGALYLAGHVCEFLQDDNQC